MNGKRILILCGCLISAPLTSGASAQAGGGVAVVTTKMVTNELRSDLNSALNSARVGGDYLLAQALMKALAAIDAWEVANKNLLGSAFSDINKTRAATVSDLRTLISQTSLSATTLADQATRMTLSAETLLSDISLQPPVYVTRYTPEVVAPTSGRNDPVIVRVQGVRLDKGKLSMNVPGVKTQLIGPREVIFTIPRSSLQFSNNQMTLNRLPITHLEHAGLWPKTVTRNIPIVTLPNQIGTIDIEIRTLVDKQATEYYEVDLGEFKGKNERQYRVANPKPGWWWNVGNQSTFRLIQGGADNGRCEGIDFNASTRDGITMYVRLDERKVLVGGGDAHTNCKLGGEVYQVIKEERVVNVPTVQLDWWEGHTINLPPQTTLQGYTVTFKAFNGKTYKFNGSELTPFAEFRQAADQIVINPLIPATF